MRAPRASPRFPKQQPVTQLGVQHEARRAHAGTQHPRELTQLLLSNVNRATTLRACRERGSTTRAGSKACSHKGLLGTSSAPWLSGDTSLLASPPSILMPSTQHSAPFSFLPFQHRSVQAPSLSATCPGAPQKTSAWKRSTKEGRGWTGWGGPGGVRGPRRTLSERKKDVL